MYTCLSEQWADDNQVSTWDVNWQPLLVSATTYHSFRNKKRVLEDAAIFTAEEAS
jgi:hypothetical protein